MEKTAAGRQASKNETCGQSTPNKRRERTAPGAGSGAMGKLQLPQ